MADFINKEVIGADYKATPGSKWKGICRFNLKETPGEFVLFDWGKLPIPERGDIITTSAKYNDERRNYAVDTLTMVKKHEKTAEAKPEAAAEEGVRYNKALKGDHRSPEDFKRTSALAQAVIFMNNAEVPGAGFDEIIRTTLRVARIFDYFLNTGKTPNLRTGDENE